MAWPERLLGLVAGLAGVLGVAASAAAVHSGAGPLLDTSARFLMFHAPALLALVALLASGTIGVGLGRVAGALLTIGLVVFCGDLALKALHGTSLFPMAAPSGGFCLMAGWALAGLAGLRSPAR